VAHHIPGRIRLRFATKFFRDPVLRDLKENPGDWAKALFAVDFRPPIDGPAIYENPAMVPGINDVRLNVPGRTLVLEYDPAVWPPAWLDELMNTDEPFRVRSLLNRMAEKFLKLISQN